MPSIKIYPPTQLPDRGVNETQFNIWKEELEVYLSQEEEFAIFLGGGDYGEWQSQEENEVRISELRGGARLRTQAQIDRVSNVDLLRKRQRDLRTVLSIIGKCVAQGHYADL